MWQSGETEYSTSVTQCNRREAHLHLHVASRE